MKKDATTTARYFIFLILVFIAWIFILHKASKNANFQTFIGGRDKSLYIEVIR